VLLGLLDQAQYYLWTSRLKLTLHGPKNTRPKFILLGPNYSKLF